MSDQQKGNTVGKRMLLSLVKERLSALDYVKNIYEDNMFLFNSIRIPQSTLIYQLDSDKMHKKAHQLFNIGMSLGEASCIDSVSEMVKRLLNIFQELEKSAESKSGGVKSLFQRKFTKSSDRATSLIPTTHVPFRLDYKECFLRLCDILIDIYKRISITNTSEYSDQFFINLNKVDHSVKIIIQNSIKIMDEISKPVLNSEFQSLTTALTPAEQQQQL